MKTKSVPILEAVAMFALAVVQVQAEEIAVPNGSFELIYKPGSTTITADLGGGWTNGVGPGTLMESGQTAAYSDGTTGTSVDIPGWINSPGWPTAYNWVRGSGVITRQNGNAPDGDYYFAGNGSAWGNPQGGAIESDAPLTTVTTVGGALSYTVSMLVNGAVVPVTLDLLADGEALTPASSVDPGAPYAWTEFSRTYDAASLAGHFGESLTIRVGWGPAASGTQSHLDKVSLSYVPGGAAAFPLTITPHASNPGHYDFVWGSQDGKLYDLVSSTDLSTAIASWPVWLGHENIVGAAPENMLTDVPGGGDSKRFFAVVEKAPPPLLSEDFEAVTGPNPPAGWLVVDNSAGATAWQVGTPSGAATGPPAAASGTQCAGTNIGADYTPSAVASLITKAFTVPAGGATLNFRQYIDTEPAPSGDLGSIRLLNGGDNSILIGGDLATGLEGITEKWTSQSIALPAVANGLSVKIEFRFESDADTEAYAGFYIDSVEVIAQ